MPNIPKTEAEYLAQVRQQLNLLERASAGATGIDERQDITNKLLIHLVNLQAEGIRLRLPEPSKIGIPPYNVRQFLLDTAQPIDDPEEVLLTGDMLTFYTDGTLHEVWLALDSPVNDWIPIAEFGNPYRYPAMFQKFYLSWTAQAGKYLRVHVGREAGAEAQIQLTGTFAQTQSTFAYDQVTVGVAAVQLTATTFTLKFGLTIKADNDNAGDIYIGNGDVTAANGVRLIAGESVTLEVDSPHRVYAIASVAAQQIQYLGV